MNKATMTKADVIALISILDAVRRNTLPQHLVAKANELYQIFTSQVETK